MNERLEFKIGSFFGIIPFLIFIVITIALSFLNAADLNMMIGAGVVGLLVGMIFVKDINKYWDTILEGLGSKVGMTAVMLWLVVGIYGNILKNGQIVEGLVWLSLKLNISGRGFTAISFLFSSIFAIATGTGFGTISTMSFILYPAGILLGSNPTVLAGAILSGAAFGDNLAPVSDTTIIAATSQEYNYIDDVADIGGTVKNRAKFVILAGIISLVLFFIFGGTKGVSDIGAAHEILQNYQNPKGLILLIPTIVVIALAVKGKNIFECLGIGILIATILGVVFKLFTLNSLFSIQDGKIVGAIPEGVAGMTTVSILLILVVSMGNILVKCGIMDSTVKWLNEKIIKSTKGAELSIFFLSTIFGILIAAINTIANICVSPFVNAIGKKNNLHPYRRSNILATSICSFPFFLPYGGCVLLLIGGLTSVVDKYPFVNILSPTDMMLTAFYPWVIWIVMLVSCIIGWDSTLEGADGKQIKANTNKTSK